MTDDKERKRIEQVLRSINASVPKGLLNKVATEQPLSPMVKKVVETAVNDPDFPEPKRKMYKQLLDSGALDKKRIIENTKVAKQIDNYIGRKINEAIKDGRLPAKIDMRNTWRNQSKKM